MIRVYGVPTCDKIKKTKALFIENKVDFNFINVRQEPISRDKLKNIIEVLGMDLVLNKKGLLYRKKGLKDKKLTNDQLFEELFNEQGMIKRPLLEKEKQFHIGYDVERILSFIGIEQNNS